MSLGRVGLGGGGVAGAWPNCQGGNGKVGKLFPRRQLTFVLGLSLKTEDKSVALSRRMFS